MKTTIATLTAVSIATSAGHARAAVHGLYPIYAQHSELLHFIDVDSRKHRGARYVYSKVSVLRREDVDALPNQVDANKLRASLRTLPPVRVESWAVDCATDTVRVAEFAGNKPTGMMSGWLVPEFGSVGYEVLTTLCAKSGGHAVKVQPLGRRRAARHDG